MNIPIEFSYPPLWGDQIFKKSEWGEINYLVGPNGTGKSNFILKIKPIFQNAGLSVRYLHSDRIVSWTKQQNLHLANSNLSQGGLNLDWSNDLRGQSRVRGEANDAFILLKENLDIRIKVEAILSQLLNRTILLEERGGFLIPSVSKNDGLSYSFKEGESHGLKEIITLLALLYDNSYNCFIIDEPELHLHPQFQTFLMKIIRDFSGNPLEDNSKKCFVLATHSPYFVDVRTPEELKHCIVFRPEQLPTYLENFDGDDEFKIKQLLPRLNTHHKQFFFSPRPVFVEGYTDQQIFSLIQESRGKLLDYNGPTFIDVHGKDELDLFLRLCRKLSIQAQIITDLDSLLNGKLRVTVSSNEDCKQFLQDKGIGTDFLRTWGEISQKSDECISEFLNLNPQSLDSEQNILHETMNGQEENDKKRYAFFVGLNKNKEKILELIPQKSDEINFITGRIEKIIQGFKKAGVHVLEKGELENYYQERIENPFNITDKIKTQTFVREKDFLLQNSPSEAELKTHFDGIIDILDSSTTAKIIDYKLPLLRHIRNFVYSIQDAFNFKSINDLESIKNDSDINFNKFKNVIEIESFEKADNDFSMKIKIIGFSDFENKSISFTNTTNLSEIIL